MVAVIVVVQPGNKLNVVAGLALVESAANDKVGKAFTTIVFEILSVQPLPLVKMYQSVFVPIPATDALKFVPVTPMPL